MLFKCELKKDGLIVERFFREGESATAVEEGLDIFQWDEGEWEIEEIEGLVWPEKGGIKMVFDKPLSVSKKGERQ